MKAIVVVSGAPEDITLNDRYTTPLLPLVDRPFLQHVVEYLVELGVNEFDFLLGHLPEKVEALLGDGTRWGSTFRYHLSPEPDRPYLPLRHLAPQVQEPVLLAHADRLPQLSLPEGFGTLEDRPILFQPEDAIATPTELWSGWIVLPPEILHTLPCESDEHSLSSWIHQCPNLSVEKVSRMLTIRTFAGLLQAQQVVAQDEFAGLLKTGRAERNAVRLGRGVVVPASVRLHAPVFIGENCRIGEGSVLGPNVVLSENCVVGTNTQINNALIFPGSYIGDGLELKEVLVDKGRLVSVRHGESVSITDSFLLGDLSPARLLIRSSHLLSRIAAALLFLVFSPLLLPTALFLILFRRAPLVYSHPYVALPTTQDPADWRTVSVSSFHPEPESLRGIAHFFLRFLPGLPSAVAGKIHLVGITPRTAESIRALPEDFRPVYLSGSHGLITEPLVIQKGTVTTEETALTDNFYCATRSLRHDLHLFTEYFRGFLQGGITASR